MNPENHKIQSIQPIPSIQSIDLIISSIQSIHLIIPSIQSIHLINQSINQSKKNNYFWW